MSKLRVYEILNTLCNEDHGNCIGKCTGNSIPEIYKRITVRLPESFSIFLGHHFHIGYDYDTNRWTVQDYDCTVKVVSIAAEDAVQRYCLQQYTKVYGKIDIPASVV